MTAAGDAWLAEMWKPCRELSREERMAKRVADEVAQEMASAPVDRPRRTVEKGAA